MGQDEKIFVRGRHSSLYAVDLPPCLPGEVLDNLIQRFGDIARAEVRNMITVVTSWLPQLPTI
jgi:hypothetical protein